MRNDIGNSVHGARMEKLGDRARHAYEVLSAQRQRAARNMFGASLSVNSQLVSFSSESCDLYRAQHAYFPFYELNLMECSAEGSSVPFDLPSCSF